MTERADERTATLDALARHGIAPDDDEVQTLVALHAAAVAGASAVDGHREPLAGLWPDASRAAGAVAPDPSPRGSAPPSLPDPMRRGDVTSAEYIDALLARADEADERIGAYVVRFDDAARAAATEADERRAAGDDRPLLGCRSR